MAVLGKPYAWWDFENGRAKDRTGRFPDAQLQRGAKVVDGKLVLGKNATLVAGQPYTPDHPSWPKDPNPGWLTYHLCHPGPGGAFPGDPNPIFFHKGRRPVHDRRIRDDRQGYILADEVDSRGTTR